jgi:hypothetical protein
MFVLDFFQVACMRADRLFKPTKSQETTNPPDFVTRFSSARALFGYFSRCRRYLVHTTSKLGQRKAERAFLYAASVTLLAYGSFVLHDFRNRL